MNSPLNAETRARRFRRWKVGLLLAFYLVAFSAAVPCIETGDWNAARLAPIHEDKAAQCRQFGAQAQAARRAEHAQRLSRSAARHDWFAGVYRREAARTRLTWLAWLIKVLPGPGSLRSH